MDEALIREQEQQLQKTGKYYKHICWMAVPPLCMACYLYGLRPLLLCGIAMLTGNLCDRLVSLLRHRVYQNGDLSNESFALVIALLMPVTVDIYVLVAAVLAGVLIGKEVFGGYGSYPFNPAAWAMLWRRCPGRNRCSVTRSPIRPSRCGMPPACRCPVPLRTP
mgnify:FL=1